MKETIILCDIDGVLADFVLGFTRLGNQWFGTPILTTADMETWSGFGVTAQQENFLWENIYRDPSWWAQLPLIATFEEMLSLTQLPGIYFVTNRPSGTLAATTKWLSRYTNQRPRVIVTQNKAMIAAAMEPAWVLEDSPHNLLNLRHACPRTNVVRFQRHYNGHLKGENERSVATVTEFLSMVEHDALG